jgi:hypothetical protein
LMGPWAPVPWRVAMAYELKTGWHGVTAPETGEDNRRRRRREAGAAGTSLSVNDLIDEFLVEAERGSALDRHGRRFSRDALGELRWCLDGHVAEELGTMSVSDMRRDDVEALIYRLGDDGVSRRRLRVVATSVRALYDYAIERRLVRRNPAERVALPDEDDAKPPARDLTRRPTIDRAISLTLQLATLGFALITLILIAQSL